MPSIKKYILIVDDSKINRQILAKILSNDYNIIEAENGQTALAILREKHESISVVLLDILMPVLDGYEVLKQMHMDTFLSKIPVIVASGQSTEDAEVKALSLGANDYVLKPYKPEIIKHRIANTIYLKETSALVNRVQYDSLTGVYGKDYFYLRVNEVLQNNPLKKYDLLCLDIERFKLVNDMYGVQVGDELLQYIGHSLKKKVGGCGFCGRVGADEFVCLLPHQKDYPKEYFTDAIEEINNFSEVIKFNLILRYGIYRIEDSSTPVNIMCDRAILAKEAIKGKYGTYFAYYDDMLRQKMLNEQLIVSNMKNALAEKQFQVYFQPKYDLKTEEIIGAEALVRWLHPEKGLLSPAEFIPLFEKNGFITDLDLYIWDQCCQKMKEWIDRGNTHTPISINVSRADIYDPNLPQIILSMVQKYDLNPRDLHLEITESAYTENPEQMIETVSKLKKFGFIIEMDDFGTGYSSLNMLSELPIDILKLDMRFIQKEEKKYRDRSVLSFIISLAKWMDLKVVAEGIETEDQVQLLQSLNCEYAQGYYYARPMPQEQFEQCLLASKIQKNSAIATQNDSCEISVSTEDPRPIIVLLDKESTDLPLIQAEYAHQYQIQHCTSTDGALLFLRRKKENLCALGISFTDDIRPENISELLEECKKKSIPCLIIYDKNNPMAKPILNMNIADYEERPCDFRQLNLRLRNALAYARMDKFEQEKNINAAIIEMRKRAEHDALTGLLNRAEFEVRIDHFFHENKEPKGVFIIMDVDNFKSINDSYGHVVGDQVLNAVGAHLRTVFPETEIIARIGGDEFSLFIPYTISAPKLQAKMRSLCNHFELNVENISISCSAGICFSPEYGINHKDLYRNADMALIAAKRHGKSQYEVFCSEMTTISSAVFELKTFQLLDNVSEATFVCDAASNEIIYINETACSILKKDKKTCLGQRCYQLFWNQNHNCDRCPSIDQHQCDFYEEDSFLKNQTPVHIKARLENWGGKKVKVHYLNIGLPPKNGSENAEDSGNQ